VTYPAQEDCWILALKRLERAAEGVLCPTLRIGLDGVRKKAIKSGEQFGDELGKRSSRTTSAALATT
jgi:hypothetical protein